MLFLYSFESVLLRTLCWLPRPSPSTKFFVFSEETSSEVCENRPTTWLNMTLLFDSFMQFCAYMYNSVSPSCLGRSFVATLDGAFFTSENNFFVVLEFFFFVIFKRCCGSRRRFHNIIFSGERDHWTGFLRFCVRIFIFNRFLDVIDLPILALYFFVNKFHKSRKKGWCKQVDDGGHKIKALLLVPGK